MNVEKLIIATVCKIMLSAVILISFTANSGRKYIRNALSCLYSCIVYLYVFILFAIDGKAVLNGIQMYKSNFIHRGCHDPAK